MRTTKNSFRICCRLGLLLIILGNITCKKKPATENYFPELGKDAIYQLARDLHNNLNVLSLALEPGMEDLSALAYFRMEKGANILSAYITNGEAGESDVRGEYPNYLAATRRIEAGEAMSYLNGEVQFLNLPHIIAARDTTKIRENWLNSQLQTRIIDLLNQFKPDIILLARDWSSNGESLRWQMLKKDLLSALQKMKSHKSGTDSRNTWKVARVLVDDPTQLGKKLPVEKSHPRFGKKYSTIGLEAAKKYLSLAQQRSLWMNGKRVNYSVIYPSSAVKVQELDSDLPVRNSRQLRWIADEIKKLSKKVLNTDKETALSHLVTILDSVNFKIGRRFSLSPQDQRALFHWKNKLESLRSTILGIKVKYRVSDETLTMRQLTYITVEEVEGLEEQANTTIYFGGIEEGWVVNEGFVKRFPYKPGESYRLLSPAKLNLTTPQAMYGLQLAKLTKPIMLFVIHRAATKEKSFIHRSIINLRFAPKFSTEILTPIVRMVAGEKLIVRFTNHSRDGVKDTVKVVHEFAESTPGPFRLNKKEATEIDTLSLIWKGNPKEGSYLIPLDIRGFNVGKFAARKFEAEINSNKNVGLITGVKDSPLQAALTRLGVTFKEVDPERKLAEQIQNLHVLLVDRRALTLKRKIKERKRDLERFVRNGGHLIYLAQDAQVWNESKMWQEIELSSSQKFDESTPLETDTTHPFLSLPNQIEPEDWQEWLYLRAYNLVKLNGNGADDFSVPVKTKDGETPLIVTKKKEKGRMTYVDLGLSPQLMNIHTGAFRLLANIISI